MKYYKDSYTTLKQTDTAAISKAVDEELVDSTNLIFTTSAKQPPAASYNQPLSPQVSELNAPNISTGNRDMRTSTPASQLQKMIILGVPDAIHRNTIIAATSSQRQSQILRLFTNKLHNYNKDFLIQMPLQHAKTLVAEGGVVLHQKVYSLRSVTATSFYRRCQEFTHNENNYQLPRTCVNCGKQRESPNCTAPANCINCTHCNKAKNGNLPTSHPASDLSCGAFRTRYAEERTRLDNLFKRNTRTSKAQRYSTPQKYHPSPEHLHQQRTPPTYPRQPNAAAASVPSPSNEPIQERYLNGIPRQHAAHSTL